MEVAQLEEIALKIKRSSLYALYNSDSGHPGSSLSWADIAASLFFDRLDLENGDEFILSKGHGAPTLYAALCLKGYADREEFEKDLRRIGSRFQGHPVAGKLPHIHASTGSLGQGLSFAMGVAEAKKLAGKKVNVYVGNVYVLTGDGELQEGQNWEAFRYGAHRHIDNLTVIIDRNGYQNDASVQDTLPLGDLEAQLRGFGWNVFQVDGHDIRDLKRVYDSADSIRRGSSNPSVIIANTVKGKGVRHIESNRKKHNGAMTGEEYVMAMRDLGFDIKEAPLKSQARPKEDEPLAGIRDAFGEALVEQGYKNDRIVVVDCDLGSATKALKFKEKFPDRFFQVGIAEQHGVSLAAGLAKEGYRPFISSFGAFLTQRAKDQIMNSVAYSGAGVVLVGSHSGLAIGKDGATQMGIDDINSMRGIPGMEIYSPASGEEAKQIVEHLAKGNGYAYLRISRRPVPSVHDGNYSFNPDRANVILDSDNGRAVSIFATGDMVHYAKESAKVLEREGIPVDVINIAKVHPIDKETVLDYGERRAGIFTLEDHGLIGGLGTIISEIAAEERLLAIVYRHGIKGFGESGHPDDLYRKHELDVEGIVNKVRAFYDKIYN